MKPRMFIGSSVEGKDIAEHITRGRHIHANDIKNVRVVDSQVVVETDTRKYTIGGSGFNPEQLRWIKNCILKVVDVQRNGNKE